ncbi:MAG TPA: hypothetical protein VIC83_02720 [Candidatus Limnocylindria bacterium]|jgi:hypothetical protein
MVIAALVVFGALLAAWLLAPAERTSVVQSTEPRPDEVGAGLTEGLTESLAEAA